MIERARSEDHEEVARLLRNESLPTADLREVVEMFVAREDGNVVGAVALEGAAPDALLRSLVVAGAYRGRGLGRALVAHAEREASARGVRTLHLLTTTAAAFFEREGYVHASRESAPATIRATAEFGTLCPESAVCMKREIKSQP